MWIRQLKESGTWVGECPGHGVEAQGDTRSMVAESLLRVAVTKCLLAQSAGTTPLDQPRSEDAVPEGELQLSFAGRYCPVIPGGVARAETTRWEEVGGSWVASCQPACAASPIFGFGETADLALSDLDRAHQALLDFANEGDADWWKRENR